MNHGDFFGANALNDQMRFDGKADRDDPVAAGSNETNPSAMTMKIPCVGNQRRCGNTGRKKGTGQSGKGIGVNHIGSGADDDF